PPVAALRPTAGDRRGPRGGRRDPQPGLELACLLLHHHRPLAGGDLATRPLHGRAAAGLAFAIADAAVGQPAPRRDRRPGAAARRRGLGVAESPVAAEPAAGHVGPAPPDSVGRTRPAGGAAFPRSLRPAALSLPAGTASPHPSR